MQGYTNLGVDQICKETGMTKGAFYNAFKSKEHFLIEALRLYGEGNTKRIIRELSMTEPSSALHRLQRFYTTMLEMQPDMQYSGCFVNNIMSEMGVLRGEVGKSSYEEYSKFLDAIEPTVLEAQNNGELQNHISARQITEMLHATFYGLLTLTKGMQDNKQAIETMGLLFNQLRRK